MQDAVIMNRASVERALGRSAFIRTYNAENKRFPGGQEERIEVPGTGLDEIKGLKSWDSYSHLERDGLPVPEVELTSEDRDRSILVGKTSPPRFLEESPWCFPTSTREAGIINDGSARREGMGRQRLRNRIS